MSLLSDLNRIVSDRRLQEDLAGNEPSIPPAPAGYVATPPKRAKGSSAGFASVALSPPAPLYLNQVDSAKNEWFQQSSTTPANYSSPQTPAAQTNIGGVEVGGSGGTTSIAYPNPSTIIGS